MEGAVESAEDGAGLGVSVVEEGAQHVAGLGHGGGGLEIVADDVADDCGTGLLRDQQGVVPVSADLAGGAGRNIGSGSLERLQVLGKPQQQEPLGHSDADAFDDAAAVLFEVELALEGVVDRLDQLADRFEQGLSGAGVPRLR